MTVLDLSPDELLTTTRSVRLRLDLERSVERSLIEECIEIAQQAPSGGNQQRWSFVIVTDAEKRQVIGRYYKQGWDAYLQVISARQTNEGPAMPSRQILRVYRSAQYLADHMGEVPLLVIPCIAGRLTGATHEEQAGQWGSILPAACNLMLAARARGFGTCWTTLHLALERNVADLLGIPFDDIMQAALIPVAHTIGDEFKPGPRRPLDEILHWDGW